MKNIIKAIIVCIFTFVFSAPAFAQNYAHTIEHLMFECYEYYGISAAVTTNIDTEDGMTLYVAIYSQEGQLLEVSSTPLKQNETDERIVYRLKVSTTLDETMTVKGMIWKDMNPYAKVISVKYDKKYNSGNVLIIPGASADYTIDLPAYEDKGGTSIKDYNEIDKDDILSRIPSYSTYPSLKVDDVTTIEPGTYEPYDGKFVTRPISPDEYIGIDVDEKGFILIP